MISDSIIRLEHMYISPVEDLRNYMWYNNGPITLKPKWRMEKLGFSKHLQTRPPQFGK